MKLTKSVATYRICVELAIARLNQMFKFSSVTFDMLCSEIKALRLCAFLVSFQYPLSGKYVTV